MPCIGRFYARIAVSKPAGGMDMCPLHLYVVLCCVGRGLCDNLTPRPKESYPVSSKDSETQKWHCETSIDILTRKYANFGSCLSIIFAICISVLIHVWIAYLAEGLRLCLQLASYV
jgi:hypothetical protein